MFEEITGALIGTFNIVMSPLAVFSPHVSLLIVSLILTSIVLLINKFSINKKLVAELKQKMAEIRENLTQAQKAGNTEEANKFLSEMMKMNNQYMRQTFKAMIISIVILALFLPWLNYKYGGIAIVNLPFEVPVVGTTLSWILWYTLVSFSMGWVIKKLLGIEYG